MQDEPHWKTLMLGIFIRYTYRFESDTGCPLLQAYSYRFCDKQKAKLGHNYITLIQCSTIDNAHRNL